MAANGGEELEDRHPAAIVVEELDDRSPVRYRIVHVKGAEELDCVLNAPGL
jgi:hypothetical protein